MEKKDENDAREFTRTPAKVKALIKSGDKIVHSGETHDLSMKGVFFQTNEKMPIGTECEVTLILGDLEEPLQVKLKGKVQRVSGDGMGLKFTEIDLESYPHLKNLVMFNSSGIDMEKVEKEIRGHIGLRKRIENPL